MRQAKVTVQRPKKRHPVTTDSRHGYRVAPICRPPICGGAARSGVGGDITYVWTAEGWWYLQCCWICIPAKWWAGR